MEYHKIQSVYKRDPATKNKRFLIGEFSTLEFRMLENIQWIGTEKVDGTNIRLYPDGRICGKTDSSQLHPGLEEYLKPISERLKKLDLPSNSVLYGEGYGAKIQNGEHYLSDRQGFVLFDAWVDGNFQSRKSVAAMGIILDVPVCPILSFNTLPGWALAIATGQYRESLLHPGAKNEGVVLRPTVELKTRTGERVISKLKFKDFGL